jgi:hypothetical protein
MDLQSQIHMHLRRQSMHGVTHMIHNASCFWFTTAVWGTHAVSNFVRIHMCIRQFCHIYRKTRHYVMRMFEGRYFDVSLLLLSWKRKGHSKGRGCAHAAVTCTATVQLHTALYSFMTPLREASAGPR